MEDSRRTYSVLVVAAAAKFHISLREMLPEDRYDPVCAAGSVSEARRALLERPFDIVVISTPLPDEFGTKLALHIIDKSSAGVLLLVKAEHYPDLAARLPPQGILLLQKPTTPPLLLQSMQLLCGTRERLRRMEEKTATIEERMAEIRLVNRAKWALIDRISGKATGIGSCCAPLMLTLSCACAGAASASQISAIQKDNIFFIACPLC